MKITKYIDIPSMEVDVHISTEDIVAAIVEEGPGFAWDAQLRITANNLATFFKAVPDEVIAHQTDEVKKIVAAFFREQAERFVPTPKTEGTTFDAAVDRVIARVDKHMEPKKGESTK